ncbi:hypothetical protein H6A64_10425 [Lacrimispora saccharolytica]|nr:hypothetical protein [Lacrimispora saccharolytica]
MILKILVDLAMTVLLFLLMAYLLVGETAHEWMGLAVFILFLFHHVLNRKWYGGLFRGNYTQLRVLQTLLNVLHLGLHWGMIMGMIRKAFCIQNPSRIRTWILRILAAGLCVYGVFAFVKHDIASYLFLRTHFVFFDMEQPLLSFFAEYLGMMGLWAILSYYAGKLLRRVGARSSR